MKNKSNEIDMLHGSITPKILLFAIPLALSSILQLLFNAADVVVLGRYVGENALAAVGSTNSLINLLVNLFIGLSAGVNVMVARYYAKQDDDEVQRIVHTSIMTAAVCGFILIFIGVILARPLLELMGSPEEVIDMSVLYIRVFFIGMPSVMLYNFGAAILRAVGDTRRPLYFLIAAGIINVILNVFFVTRVEMGVAGVALATTISNTISALLVIRTLMRENSSLKLHLNKLKIEFPVLRKIFKIGIPAGLQGCIFSISNVVIQSSVNSFGAVVMAGSTAAANIEGFIYNAMNAVYQANLSFTSQNIGAGKYSRINKIMRSCVMLVTSIGLVMGVSSVIFGNQLLSIYNKNPEVINAGLLRLEIIGGFYFLCGWMDVIVGSLRGMGYAVFPMIVSLIGACGFRILWVFTIFQLNRTIATLFAGYPISWLITALAHFATFYYLRKKFPREDRI